MHLLNRGLRPQQVGFSCSRRSASDIDAGYRSLLGQYDRAAGRTPLVCEVPDRDA
jgi:hypothetical protein